MPEVLDDFEKEFAAESATEIAALGIKDGEKPTDTPPPPPPIITDKDLLADTPPPPTEKNPRDLGFEVDNWEALKTELSDVKNLREKLAQAEKTPKSSFANEKVAQYNQFVAKTGIEDMSVFSKINAINDEADALTVLTTQYIIDHPNLVGKEELVSKKIAKDFQVDSTLFTAEEIEMNTLTLEEKAAEARIKIKGLQESLKVAPSVADTPEDYTLREPEWKAAISKDIAPMVKLPVPIYNVDKKEPEHFLDVEIPKEFQDAFAESASKLYSTLGKVGDEKVKQRMHQDMVKEYLFSNFDKITLAISNKVAADTEKRIDAEYNGAGQFRDRSHSGAGGVEDDSDKM